MHKATSLFVGCVLSTAVLAATNSWADDGMDTYQLIITNLTPGQPIAPAMATTHRAGQSFFTAGAAPMPELADLAEAGNGKPMAAKLLTLPGYTDAQVAAGGIAPGKTITMTVNARRGIDHLSLGAMLGNTNDAFIALRDVELPKGQQTVTYMADGYDAGTETNDESCSTVPGPACGGVALSPEDSGEGFVHIHNGIHGISGLNAAKYDWRNPVAQVAITRVNK
ncbi:MAG: spondin domain-containing protein [Gammaproteobacteria bacterium]|nr:spondin domain-containing protein [Gammaproteobacteria bacterium]